MASKAWVYMMVIVISATRIGMGIYKSLTGPTLLYLADNVDASVTKISSLFSGRSIGILLGAVLGGIMKNRLGPDFRHLFTLGLGIIILALLECAVPWIAQFWILIVDVTIAGIMYGFLDAGLQAIILQIWGEKGSRSQIQLFHFMFSFGAIIGPFIANPFLVMADSRIAADESCPNSVEPNETTTPSSVITVTDFNKDSNFNPTGYVFIISAIWFFIIGLLTILLSALNAEGRVAEHIAHQGHTSEEREEERICDVTWLFIPVAGYYFCTVASEGIFYNYIYSVSLCSELDFTVSQATHINSVFWAGLGLGRLSGIFASAFVQPRTIIIFGISGAIIDSLFMSIFGEHTAWLAWLVSGLHGYFTAMLYPSGISWISQITNISGTYMFVSHIGNASGSLTMLALSGYLFDIRPFSVMYQVFVLSSINALFYAWALYVGKRHLQKIAEKNLEAGEHMMKPIS